MIIYVQEHTYEDVVVDVSNRQLTSLTTNVTESLGNFIDGPFRATVALSDNIVFNRLFDDQDDLHDIEALISNALKQAHKPLDHIDVISFGNQAGNYVGFRREQDESLTLLLKDERTDSNLVIYRGETDGADIRSIVQNYDPRVRPWYQPALSERIPVWSNLYSNVDERQEITISALAPIIANGQIHGVIASDIKVHTFNKFLTSLKDSSLATIYVMDQSSRLVAHSSLGSVLSWGTDKSEKGLRLLAEESTDNVIQQTAQYIDAAHLDDGLNTNNFAIDIDGQRYFTQVAPFTDEFGIQWSIVVSISETDLLGNFPKAQQESWVLGLVVCLFGIATGLFAFNQVTAPIAETANAAKDLSEGNWESELPKAGKVYEISMLVNAFNEMASNLQASFKALRAQLIHDSLTMQYSREGLIEASLGSQHQPSVLLLAGIDRFRDINDSIGHINGDRLLVVISERLNTIKPEGSLIGRIGGDEFAIYVPNYTEEEEIQLLSMRIMECFASPFVIDGESIVVNISLGIVQSSGSLDMTTLLRNGSIALSNAKQDVSHISYYRPEMADESKRKTKIIAEIKEAIENKEFVPFYQPIINLDSGAIAGAEALARWISPTRGLVPPLEFIPISEEHGLIGDIGHQILYRACLDTQTAIAQGKWDQDFCVHVNVSVNQISSPNYVTELKNVLQQTRLPAKNLALEITESKLADNDPVIINNLNSIKELGIHIAIDDFGTGYSSLAYLHKLPFDSLKIDRSFINQLESENVDSSIVSAIVNITRTLKVNVVAEGVETNQQADLLNSLGCPQAQGFLYSRPVAFDEWPTVKS
ncbi:EAL domain-containing protein [Vibrio maerlii]|uniref:bifunctional diguanylate cyclase/phosphodiesterase n=1 Tax=Vibrio maerlii TaxID=2231648 RepID=UPI0030B8BA5C